MNSPEQNETYFNSYEYTEWKRLARINNHTNRQVGYWQCYVTTSGNILWEYINS